MNIYQWYNSEEKPQIIKDCMVQVEFMSYLDNYVLVPVNHGTFVFNVDVRSESDFLRCQILSKDPDGCWIDVDCEIINKFTPPKDGKPYFSQGRVGQANGDVIIANGNSGIFSDILEYFYALTDRRPGWLQIWLQANKDKIGLIPRGYYRHLGIGHTGHLTDGQTMGVDGAIIKKVDGQLIITHRG